MNLTGARGRRVGKTPKGKWECVPAMGNYKKRERELIRLNVERTTAAWEAAVQLAHELKLEKEGMRKIESKQIHMITIEEGRGWKA